MKQIDEYCSEVERLLEKVRIIQDPPASSDGTWFINVRRGQRTAVVEWNPVRGFGVSRAKSLVWGELAHERFARAKDAARRTADLLSAGGYTESLKSKPTSAAARVVARARIASPKPKSSKPAPRGKSKIAVAMRSAPKRKARERSV